MRRRGAWLVALAFAGLVVLWVTPGVLRRAGTDASGSRVSAHAEMGESEGEREGEESEEEEKEREEAFADDALAMRRAQMEDENGKVAPNGLADAAAGVRRLRAATQARSGARTVAGISRGAWTPLGPGNVGGRTRAIVVSPANAQTMWAGSVSGGIWKTTDGGQAWLPLDDFIASLRVASMAIDPVNPDVLYAGTGESFTQHVSDFIPGDGIFTSADGGASWNQLATTAGADFDFVNRIAIQPGDSDVLLAATETGIWRTASGGAQPWTNALAGERVRDLDFHPTNGDLAVAGGFNGKAWYTENGGAGWTAASGLPGTGRVEIAYARSSPNIVYASVNINGGELWRSSDGGKTYARRSPDPNPDYLGTQGSYDNALWVDPTNANRVVVGGIDLWRSDDGGQSLTRISDWAQEQRFGNSAHADHHAIVEVPGYNGTTNRTVLFGNDGGVYRAADVATVQTASGWQELNNNYGVTQFYSGAGNASGRILGGTQDNGTPAFQGGTETWASVLGGDGGYVATDPTDASHVYGEYVFLHIFRNDDGGTTVGGSHYIWGDEDRDGNCTKVPPYSIPDACDASSNFIAPFVLDPNNANRMLVGGEELWRTNDATTPNTATTGPSWASIKPPSGTGNYISAIAVAPGNPDLIWVGYDDGIIHKTTNGTAASPTWTRVDTDAMPARWVLRLTIDPSNTNVVYASFGGFAADNLWRTTDGGATVGNWTVRGGSGATALPSAPVRDLAINPSNSSWLYAGTEVGVFASTDGGATWGAPQEGPANVSADELFWIGTRLHAATHGRGMFRTDVSIPRPGNDDFADGIDLTGTSATRGADTNLGATKQTGEPKHADNAGGASVWYDWTPAQSGSVTIDTRTSEFDTTLGVYTGTAVGSLARVTANDDESGTLRSSIVTFDASAGTTYRIAVDGYRSNNGIVAKGKVVLHLAQTAGVGTQPLTVAKAGTGGGSVTSQPSGIDCGADCSQDYATGTAVTLTAAPVLGSTFAGWSGACTNATGTCEVTMDAARSVTATFNVASVSRTLTVTKAGSGSGTVTSQPAGVDCGADCAQDYPDGTVVTLTAGPAPGMTFAGWSGACTGAVASCEVTMNANRQVTATFNAAMTNDDFSARRLLTGASGTADGSNVGAHKELGEPNHAGNQGGASVWFDYTPAAAGLLRLDTRGSQFDTLLAAYTGPGIGQLQPVASNDDEDYPTIVSSLTEFSVAAGTTYRIAVDGFNGGGGGGAATGELHLHWQLTPDATPPSNPALSSPSHTVGAWSSNDRVVARWSGAADAGSGVDGYSVLWDTSPGGVPDTLKDAEAGESQATSPSLADGGSHWFHLRTRDKAGNWSATASLGPFRIDRTAPSAGETGSTSHLPGVASLEETVSVAWTGAGDASSGLAGFSFSWDEDPAGEPDDVPDADAATSSTTSPALAPGSHWFHLRALDRAGNLSTTATAGPFVIAQPSVAPPAEAAAAPAPPPPPAAVPATRRCVVPALRGKTLRAAKKALRKAGCALGNVKRVSSQSVKAGRVLRQTPAPRARRPVGTRVRVVVSRGRRPAIR